MKILNQKSHSHSRLRPLLIAAGCVAIIACFCMQSYAGASPQQSTSQSITEDNQKKRAPRDPAAGIDKRIERMTEVLSLTENQQASIRVIMENLIQEMESLRSSAGDGNKPDRTEMKALKDACNEQIMAELTAEQQELYEQMRADGKQKGRQRKGEQGRGRGNKG